LPRVSPLFYHIYSTINTLVGLTLVLILFDEIKQRFKVPEFKSHYYILYILLIFGFMTNLLNFSIGFVPYIEDEIIAINQEIKKGIIFDLSQLLFLSMIFFSIAFAVYSIFSISLIKKKQPKINIDKDEWIRNKIIIIATLSLASIFYIIVLIEKKNNYHFLFEDFINKHHNIIILLMPYFIHVLNGILVFSYYYELKYFNYILSQNLDIDFHFDSSESFHC